MTAMRDVRGYAAVATVLVGCTGPGTRAGAVDTSGDASVARTSNVAAEATSATPFIRRADGTFVATRAMLAASLHASTTIDADGAHLAGDNAAWSLGLHVARVGRMGERAAMRDVAAARPIAHAARVEIARDGVTEWFADQARGLEHGVDIEARPAGSHTDALVVEVAADGLVPRLVDHGKRIDLRDARGRVALSYAELSAKDADGHVLPASLDVAQGAIVLRVNDAGARYPLAIDPIVFGPFPDVELVESSPGSEGDAFGTSVSIDGSSGGLLAIVGAPGATAPTRSTPGAAYLFTQEGSSSAQLGDPLSVASASTDGDAFGQSVGISGTTIIVGAPTETIGSSTDQGAAYLFTVSGTAWSQIGLTLSASDGAAGDRFGCSVAISGGLAVVGALQKTVGGSASRGAAYIFAQTGTTWAQQGPALTAADGSAGDTFGDSVAISVAASDATVVVGAYQKTIGTHDEQGAAYVFVQNGTAWTQQGAALVAADGSEGDAFGGSVAISGDTVLVGASGKEIGSHDEQGAAYLFARSGTTWAQEGPTLVASDGAAYDAFGVSVAIDDVTAVIGASGHLAGTNADQGAAYIFAGSGTTWTQQSGSALEMNEGAAGDGFGAAVSLYGTTALFGAPDKTISAHAEEGAAFVLIFGYGPGAPCTSDDTCAWSFACVEGVCCDAGCVGICRSCLGSRTGLADGTCGAVSSLSECAPCAVDSDCPTGAACVGTACTALEANGAACTAANQCLSGSCADGICCNTDCAAPCQACIARATGAADGTCGNVLDGIDPLGACAASTCSGATLTKSVCNGSGACRESVVDCGPDKCTTSSGASACATSCTADSDCAAGAYCGPAGTCAPALALSNACTGNDQCASGFCVDGVCCNQACNGQCEACDATGTCAAVKGAPHGSRAACNGAGTACAGACDGNNIASCAYPSIAVSCGAGCVSGSHQVCDNTGNCLAATPCPGNFACADATSCVATCTTNSDCAASFVCSAGSCIAQPPARCSTDGTTSIPENDAGSPQPCSPYKCGSEGACEKACATTNDCLAGFTCETTEGAGECVASSASSSSGGGCTVGAGRGPGEREGEGAVSAALLLFAGAIAARRGTVKERRPRR